MTESPWIQTFTGRKFHPFAPDPAEVCVEDVAHHLSLKCRWGGCCLRFFSVAEHCVIGSLRLVMKHGPRLALQFLLHDAHEAYLPDFPRPIKHLFPEANRVADALDVAIHAALGCPLPTAEEKSVLKAMDNTLLWTERRDLMLPTDHEWLEPAVEPLKAKLDRPFSPGDAEQLFLEEYHRLLAKLDPESAVDCAVS